MGMLKECARTMMRNRSRLDGKVAHIPFRSSKLTHLLQTCFTDELHRTVVITTLSPSPPDVEHSLNSLQHVGMMRLGRTVENKAYENATTKKTAETSGASGSFSNVEG